MSWCDNMHARQLAHAKQMVGHGHVKKQVKAKSILLVMLCWTSLDACYGMVKVK